MKPDVTPVLEHLSIRLAEEIAPQLKGFHAGNAGMIGAMLKMLSEHWNGAVANLVEENMAIRAILWQAAKYFCDREFRDLAIGDDGDLHVDALEAENAKLRAALIDAHARVEEEIDAEARRIENIIWEELRMSVKRRSISSANF